MSREDADKAESAKASSKAASPENSDKGSEVGEEDKDPAMIKYEKLIA